MKTPEQMAEEYADCFAGERRKTIAKKSFFAGYEARKNEENFLKRPAGWISVKERLPETLESVLVVYAPTNESKNDYRMECWNWPETEVYETKFITHWMPLPEAPKEEK